MSAFIECFIDALFLRYQRHRWSSMNKQVSQESDAAVAFRSFHWTACVAGPLLYITHWMVSLCTRHRVGEPDGYAASAGSSPSSSTHASIDGRADGMFGSAPPTPHREPVVVHQVTTVTPVVHQAAPVVAPTYQAPPVVQQPQARTLSHTVWGCRGPTTLLRRSMRCLSAEGANDATASTGPSSAQ